MFSQGNLDLNKSRGIILYSMPSEYNPCKYLRGGPEGRPGKCTMIGRVNNPTETGFIDRLSPDYIRLVCNDETAAKRLCPHYVLLSRSEAIGKRLAEITEEAHGLAERLSETGDERPSKP